jgi:hypothetical protein
MAENSGRTTLEVARRQIKPPVATAVIGIKVAPARILNSFFIAEGHGFRWRHAPHLPPAM